LNSLKKVYVETSVVSYLTARSSLNLVVATNQKITELWWSKRKGDFDLFVSEVVFQEAEKGDAEASQKRVNVIKDIPVLSTPEEAFSLAQTINQRSFNGKVIEDALHIAISALNAMDYLLTWNFKHIANAEMRYDIIRMCNDAGYECPIICSPAELLGEAI